MSRKLSTNRKNDRLQERLAKAVVNRSGGKSTDVSRLPSRSTSPSKVIKSPRASFEAKIEVVNPHLTTDLSTTEKRRPSTVENDTMTDVNGQTDKNVTSSITTTEIDEVYRAEHASTELHGRAPQQRSKEVPATRLVPINTTPAMLSVQYEEPIEKMRSEHESAELQHQEEMHWYLEHIDALQAKLQYLTKQAEVATTKIISESGVGSVEQMLAMKDQKIALLLEEGQKLSQTELKHMTTIRKLRTKAKEDEKILKQIEKQADELGDALKTAQQAIRASEASQRINADKIRSLAKVEEELAIYKLENGKKDTVIEELRNQLAHAMAASNTKELNNYTELLELEKKVVDELRDDLTNAKLDKALADERHQMQYRELQEKSERERERAKIADSELRSEFRVLEGRLESFRARAEEVSSGSSGDTQAKLLRQIETLQTQYSVASENWRGIEGSLLAKITNLEAERDEIAKREADVRRKIRTMASRVYLLEDQLEQATNRIHDLEADYASQSAQVSQLRESQAEAVSNVTKLESELRAKKETWQSRLEERLDSEKRDLLSNTPEVPLRTDIPLMSSRQRVNADRAIPVIRRNPAGLGMASAALPFPDRSMERRHTGQPSHFLDMETPHRQDSRSSTPQPSMVNGIPDTPSFNPDHQDDFFDGLVTPATPERTVNDIFSVSTSAAGPSVQLVERMSAAVRRLESEKAVFKDELDRLSAQRDEAREQVVALMREAEEKREVGARAVRLEAEVAEINQRYQTTLEMLGEKSELVEELRADVADVKQMYRDFVDSTMR